MGMKLVFFSALVLLLAASSSATKCGKGSIYNYIMLECLDEQWCYATYDGEDVGLDYARRIQIVTHALRICVMWVAILLVELEVSRWCWLLWFLHLSWCSINKQKKKKKKKK